MFRFSVISRIWKKYILKLNAWDLSLSEKVERRYLRTKKLRSRFFSITSEDVLWTKTNWHNYCLKQFHCTVLHDFDSCKSIYHMLRKNGRRTVIWIWYEAWFINVWNHFVWLRVTDEGSLPEMRIWSILWIKSD